MAGRIQAEVPGLQIDTAQRVEDLIGDLTGTPQPIEIKLYGQDTAELVPIARRVAHAVSRIPGATEVQDGVKLAGDGLALRLDPARVGLEGMTASEVALQANAALVGNVATSLVLPTKTLGVRVSLAGARGLRQDALARLPIRPSDGHVFPLDRVADIRPVLGQPQISRDDLQPVIAVTGRVQRRAIDAVIGDIRTALSRPGLLPPSMRWQLGGLYQQQQIAFAGLLRVFCAALVAELLLLLYGGLAIPLVIIGCALLSTVAVFIALWLSGVALNIIALIPKIRECDS